MILSVYIKSFKAHSMLTMLQHLAWWILTPTVSSPLIRLPIQEVIPINCIRQGLVCQNCSAELFCMQNY